MRRCDVRDPEYGVRQGVGERRLDLGEVQPERAGEAKPIYIVIVGTI